MEVTFLLSSSSLTKFPKQALAARLLFIVAYGNHSQCNHKKGNEGIAGAVIAPEMHFLNVALKLTVSSLALNGITIYSVAKSCRKSPVWLRDMAKPFWP